MHADQNNISKLHKILMRSARSTIGNYCCRLNIKSILDKCKWLEIRKFIAQSSLVTLHNIIKTKIPYVLSELFNNIENHRNSKDISTKYSPRTQKVKKIYIYNIINYYNKMPDTLKEKSKLQFKILSKTWIDQNFGGINDTHD